MEWSRCVPLCLVQSNIISVVSSVSLLSLMRPRLVVPSPDFRDNVGVVFESAAQSWTNNRASRGLRNHPSGCATFEEQCWGCDVATFGLSNITTCCRPFADPGQWASGPVSWIWWQTLHCSPWVALADPYSFRVGVVLLEGSDLLLRWMSELGSGPGWT